MNREPLVNDAYKIVGVLNDLPANLPDTRRVRELVRLVEATLHRAREIHRETYPMPGATRVAPEGG